MTTREFRDNVADVTASPIAVAEALKGLSNDIAADVQARGLGNAREVESSLNSALARQLSVTNTDRVLGALSGSSQGLSGLMAHHTREQQTRVDRQRDAKARSATANSILLLDNLRAFEADTAAKYGEDFAENLFADLHGKGAISDKDYQEAMAIEDPEERKRTIAAKIQEGLDDGSIKAEDLKDHPWAREWLDKHEEYNQARDAEAQAGLRGEVSANEMTADAQDEASKIVSNEGQATLAISGAPDIQSAFEIAAIGTEQSEIELDDTQEIAVNLSSQLGGLSV